MGCTASEQSRRCYVLQFMSTEMFSRRSFGRFVLIFVVVIAQSPFMCCAIMSRVYHFAAAIM